MKQELAPESRSAKTCTGGVLLVLTVTWATNTLFGLNDSLSYGHLRKDTSIASFVCLGGVKTKTVST